MTPKRSILAKVLFTGAFIAFSAWLPAQNNPNLPLEKKQVVLSSASFTILHFTDFATSPLLYIGAGVNAGAAWQWETPKREHLLAFEFLSGMAMANAPLSNFYQTSNSSTVVGLTFSDQHLFRILEPSLPGFLDIKIGGAFNSTTYFRSNGALQNNGTGVESLFNVMFSGKASVDISRKSPWSLDLYLFEINFKKLERYLSFGFNTGLLNMSYRPGYAYNIESEFDGSNTNVISNLLAGHTWTVNGWKSNTCLEYSQYRPSGNGFKLAYVWEAAKAPGKYENFQIATHSLRYTMIINMK
jgi:hypothetical protein